MDAKAYIQLEIFLKYLRGPHRLSYNSNMLYVKITKTMNIPLLVLIIEIALLFFYYFIYNNYKKI